MGVPSSTPYRLGPVVTGVLVLAGVVLGVGVAVVFARLYWRWLTREREFVLWDGVGDG
jgi:hypothetical protein